MSTTIANEPAAKKTLKEIVAEAEAAIDHMAAAESDGHVPDGATLLAALQTAGRTQEHYEVLVEVHHDARRFEHKKAELEAAHRRLRELQNERNAAIQEREAMHQEFIAKHGARDIELFNQINASGGIIAAAEDEYRRLSREVDSRESMMNRRREAWERGQSS